jgi:hypothetical protein
VVAPLCIDCKGDAVVGDEEAFEHALFTGSYKKATLVGFELIKAKMVKESYGADKQQHTFTLSLPDGSTKRIKGRNLYRNDLWRKPWADPSLRSIVAEEKHCRGDTARKTREERRQEKSFYCAPSLGAHLRV